MVLPSKQILINMTDVPGVFEIGMPVVIVLPVLPYMPAVIDIMILMN